MRTLVPTLIAVLALTGCGGSGDGMAPAAGPARSPALDVAPVGRVLPAGRVAGLDDGTIAGGRRGTPRAAVIGGGRVAVVDPRRRTLALLDRRTREPLQTIHVGIGPTHVVARGERLFVVDTRGNGLIEVLTDPLRIHRRTQLGNAPYAIAFDAVHKRFWITLTATNEVAELTDRRVLRTFPTVRQPNAVAVDSTTGRVYVAGADRGAVQVLDPPPYAG